MYDFAYLRHLPSRRIALVEADFAAACEDRAALDARIASRTAQFSLLMSSIAELQKTFADDEEMARLQSAAASASAAPTSAADGERAEQIS